MTADLIDLLSIAALTAGACGLAWYALGVFATWHDTREDDADDYDKEEPR